MLGSQRVHCHDKTNSGVVDSSEGVRRKGRTSSTTEVRLTGIEREYWIGTEISRLGGYGFRGTVTAGDGSKSRSEPDFQTETEIGLYHSHRMCDQFVTFVTVTNCHKFEIVTEFVALLL